MSLYYVQTQAPAGNYTDSIGTTNLEAAMQHAKYLMQTCVVRIVERLDAPIWEPEYGEY